jgi:ABC-2 type transport system ATP-binding protein
VAGLADLRRLRRTEVDASFAGAGPDPAALAALPGVAGVRAPGPGRLLLSLSGPPGPALAALAAAGPLRLDAREPSLEEIFLEYYGQANR